MRSNLTMADVVRTMFGSRPPAKKQKMAREHKPPKAKTEFMVRLPDGKWISVQSYTKSEARAVAKDVLGLNDRLPDGTTVESW